MSHGSGVSWFAMGRFDMVTAGMWLSKKTLSDGCSITNADALRDGSTIRRTSCYSVFILCTPLSW